MSLSHTVSVISSVPNNGVTLKSGLGTIQRHGTIRFRSIAYEFLLAFRGDYGPVLYHFRDEAKYWSKMEIFYTRGIFQSEYCHKVWYGKSRMVWLRDGKEVSGSDDSF